MTRATMNVIEIFAWTKLSLLSGQFLELLIHILGTCLTFRVLVSNSCTIWHLHSSHIHSRRSTSHHHSASLPWELSCSKRYRSRRLSLICISLVTGLWAAWTSSFIYCSLFFVYWNWFGLYCVDSALKSLSDVCTAQFCLCSVAFLVSFFSFWTGSSEDQKPPFQWCPVRFWFWLQLSVLLQSKLWGKPTPQSCLCASLTASLLALAFVSAAHSKVSID